MSWYVQEVHFNFVNRTWPLVEPFLLKSVRHSHGELSIQEVQINVLRGIDSLYIALDEDNQIQGAATVNFFNRTDNRVAFVTNIAGKLLADQDTFSQFCTLLRAKGATCIEGAVRDSLLRLWARLGAHKKTTMIQIPL
jgi:hypothetical protein